MSDTRAHPDWPARPGVEVGCDNRDCATCYEQWFHQPLRNGEYDVPVMFRVTAPSIDEATTLVADIVAKDPLLVPDKGPSHIVPMYVPDSDRSEPAFVLERAENPHPRMLAEALDLRDKARKTGDSFYRVEWRGYLEAMCAATGETPEAIEAWMDRAALSR